MIFLLTYLDLEQKVQAFEVVTYRKLLRVE